MRERAGIQTSENLVNIGVNVVIVSEIGPNADRVLRTARIKIYKGEMISVKKLIQKLKESNYRIRG